MASKISVNPRVQAPDLPRPPQYIINCFEKVTKVQVKAMDTKALLRLIVTIRRSEVQKHHCGKDMLQWYDKVRVSYGSK